MMIEKLRIKKLDIKKDSRGWLAELIKSADVDNQKFGQIGITVAYPGQTKGGHYHTRKREWYCVLRGSALLTLVNIKTNKKTEVKMGEKNMILIEIPINHFHFIKNVGKKDMYLLFYTNEVFDLKDSDTFNV